MNKGTYRVRAIVAGAKEEKTVTVDRYVLPKFKSELKTDRRFYQPGETVKAELQVNYFFGKPVAGGKVQVKCSKFDVGYVDFQVLDGQTDAAGHFSFEVKLPASFVGQPLEAGKASAKLEIAVTDTADHKETITKNVAVTAAPILVTAVPESGELVPGLENRIYVVTTYADSTPARCKVAMDQRPGRQATDDPDRRGRFRPVHLHARPSPAISAMRLAASDEKGQAGRANLTLEQQGQDRRHDPAADRPLALPRRPAGEARRAHHAEDRARSTSTSSRTARPTSRGRWKSRTAGRATPSRSTRPWRARSR